jgi:hypothetical protein
MKVRAIKRRLHRRVLATAVVFFPSYLETWHVRGEDYRFAVKMTKLDSLQMLALNNSWRAYKAKTQ